MASRLFSSLQLRDLEIHNRIVIAPMCQYAASEGNASDWHLMHLGHLAVGGAGMLLLEATAVEPAGRITPGCLGLYSDKNERSLRRIVDFSRVNSKTALGIQLSHAGRKASSRLPWQGGSVIDIRQGGWRTMAPSAIPHAPSEPPPHALNADEMRAIAEAFCASAERADRIGFDAVELHAAHGYLLHQFLSPLSNQRTDEYGGSLENRMRYPLEVFAQVRSSWPANKPLGLRLSATDWVGGGWDIEQTVAFSRRLVELGCDWIDVSSGGLSTEQRIVSSPGYQVPFAQRVRIETGAKTIAVGMITEPRQAEDILSSGAADLVALARGMLNEPRWAWRAARELGGEVHGPKEYYRRPPPGTRGIFINARAEFR